MINDKECTALVDKCRKDRELIPTLEWMKENIISPYAAISFWCLDPTKYQAYLNAFRINHPDNWQDYIMPEHAEEIIHAKNLAKTEKLKQIKAKGGLGKQSNSLKEKLSKPLYFKHVSGANVTVLDCASVAEIAQELSKISFVHYTNLSKVINGTALSSKGWSLASNSS